MNLDPIVNVMRQIFNWIHGLTPGASYGITIIIFTFILKIILLPLNIIQTKSTVKTQMLQPRLKELQSKYKNDPQKLQEAQMALYKEEGFNPFGGCLPMLIQMPVLFAVFYVFQGSNMFMGDAARFLWVPNLALKDPLYILPVLSGISTYFSTAMLTPKNQDAEANPMASNKTNLIMSVFFLYVSLKFPAGLVLYWTVNNFFQLVIQYLMNKMLYKKAEVVPSK